MPRPDALSFASSGSKCFRWWLLFTSRWFKESAFASIPVVLLGGLHDALPSSPRTLKAATKKSS
jgi:hypothetical protein